MQDNAYLFLIPLFPLLGAIINGILALSTSQFQKGPSEKLVGTIAVLSVALSFGVCLYLVGSLLTDFPGAQNPHYSQTLWTWFSAGGIHINFSFLFDHLSSMMLMFITGIGSLIHLYSVGYMKGDRGFARFMAYMNLFMFSMIMLVMGGNLLVTFLGWEGVGLCSYLLIGFWHQDHLNNDAARKAFITNRVGDLGFLLGTFVLFYAMFTTPGQQFQFDFMGISLWSEGLLNGGPIPEQTANLITVATFLLFFACTAKSAQIPLLTWLPDAMAGPTPVSALIHAATMVTAGVFLVCRMGNLFMLSESTMTLITIIGILTALYAAICAVFQWDIKKVLAYSTVSQLGFMFMAVGVGAFDVALFHVLTHAFFKATLFLGAGSVIHSLHHEQDMRKMGQLHDKLPVTRVSMLFAWWAICGLPLGSGFMSKDLILERLFYFSSNGAHTFGQIMWFLAIIAACLTAFYMTRLLILTFYSNDRVDHEHVGPVKEAPFIMSAPVLILGIGSLIAGLLWCDPVLVWMMSVSNPQKPVQGGGMTEMAMVDFDSMRLLPEYLKHSLSSAHVGDAMNHAGMIMILGVISVAVAVVGCVLAFMKFRRGLDDKERTVEDIRGFAKQWTFIFDTAYDLAICKPILYCSKCIHKIFDQLLLGNIIKGIGISVQYIGDGCRGLQRGHVRISMAISLITTLVLFAIVIFGSY